ncbi:unnamed protein product, partial [Iphiclides podalirius]
MYIVFAVLFALATASSLRPNKQYRNDYVYNPKTDAFYKLHIEMVWIGRAQTVCQAEGAHLMVPNRHDIVQLHGMLKEFPDIGDLVWVANDGLAHESAEEQQIINLQDPMDMSFSYKGDCEVVNRQGDIQTCHCYRLLPFICKADAATVAYDPHCKVYSTGYQYYESVGGCYKIPRIASSWNEAYQECRAEGSHLVVINSKAEQQLIYNITNSAPPVERAMATWFFFAGFRAHKTTNNSPRVFKTVFNQTLEEAGFAEWSPDEPNNAGGNEYCGTIFKNNAKYNDIDCSHLYAFICEKEIESNRT